MKNTLYVLLAAVALLLTAAYFVGGSELVAAGLTQALRTALRAALLIAVAFIVIGQLQVMVTSEMISKWLSRYTGLKSIVFSAMAGGLFPGGPYIFYPFLAGFKGKGIPFYLIFSFVGGKQGYDLTRLPLEASLTTPGLALLRNLLTLPFPIIMGLLARRFFPHGLSSDPEKSGDWQ